MCIFVDHANTQVKQTEGISDTLKLFNVSQTVKDSEQLEIDHRLNIESLDMKGNDISRGLDSLAHLV